MSVFWTFPHAVIPRNRAFMLKLALVANIVNLDYNVILQDSDVFWMQDPRYLFF